MKKPLRKIYQPHMLRPILYRAFTRMILALTASLLWNHFVNQGRVAMNMYAFLFMGALFGAAAWMSYLRLDGIKAPQFDKKIFDWKRQPKITYGDMIDHVDEEIVQFDDLEEDEQNLCLLLANGACCIVFIILSFL